MFRFPRSPSIWLGLFLFVGLWAAYPAIMGTITVVAMLAGGVLACFAGDGGDSR